jgi:haloacetate dehalogenase
MLDILPSHHVWANADAEWAKKSWHWVFQIQPAPFPEKMMSAVPPEWYMGKKLSKPGIGLDFMSKETFSECVRCFTKKIIIGSCADYRACATCDFDMDDVDFKANCKIKPPTLAIWEPRAIPAKSGAIALKSGKSMPKTSSVALSTAAIMFLKKNRMMFTTGS